MPIIVKIVLISAFCYAVTYYLGMGTTKLLLKGTDEEFHAFFAPWVGIAQTAFILMALGIAGFGTKTTFWIPVIFSTILFWNSVKNNFSLSNLNPFEIQNRVYRPLAILFSVVCVTALLMLPNVYKSNQLSAFSLGNLDPVVYTMSAKTLREEGLMSYVQAARERNNNWDQLKDSDQLVADFLALGRWLPLYYLSFLSLLVQEDPANLFTFLTLFSYALFIPVIYSFMKFCLDMKRVAAIAAGALILVNPHILYIGYHGFMAQIAGMGFFICFLCRLPVLTETEKPFWSGVVLSSLFGAGVLAAYPELFPFLMLGVLFYFGWSVLINFSNFKNLSKRFIVFLLLVVLLSPYQVYASLTSIQWSHPGGWPITSRYYLFPFQLGFYSAHPVTDPIMAAELLFNPFIIFLLLIGCSVTRHSVLMCSIAVPFLISGVITYAKDWNYKYFKNLTYIYFWAPILMSQGFIHLKNLFQRGGGRLFNWRSILLVCLAGIYGAIFVVSAKNGRQVFSTVIKNGLFVPEQFHLLKEINQNPAIDNIFFQGLTFWESNWAIYYLDHKKVAVPRYEAGLITDEVGSVNDQQFKYVLTQTHPDKSLLGNRVIEDQVLELGNFSLYRLR